MAFLNREEMQARLDELVNPETAETRRVELINELGQQHASGLSELESLQSTFEEQTARLNESRDAMALMYTQLNAQNFGGAEGGTPEPSIQETITLDDLLANR